MNTLQLALKREYFMAIVANTKMLHFLLYNEHWCKAIKHKRFDRICLKLRHPKKTDVVRRITRPWKGYQIVPLKHPEFGTETVKVFAIIVN